MTISEQFDAPIRRSWRSRKVAAILAGGLVLGIGAAVTLAAWNDSEFATGTFTAGTFNMQGSTDGTAYADHASSGGAATLNFTVPTLALSPNTTVYAPFSVRLAANTTNAANVVLQVPTTTGVTTGLTYSIIQPSAFGCTSATTGTSIVAPGTAVSSAGAPAGNFTLAAPAPVTAAGAAVNLCIAVTAGATLTQGQTGTITWQFLATSN